MGTYKYSKILSKAQECKDSVKKDYKLGISKKWSYYFAKSILNPKKDIKKIDFDKEPKHQQDKISRQISKADYTDVAKRLVTYVEKHKQLPNYVVYKNFKIKPSILCYVFAKVLLHYKKDGKFPKEVNINSKIFNKPVETGNVVYDEFVKVTGYKPKKIDDFFDYVAKYWHYEFYFDDHKSNKQVIHDKGGNCTDLTQVAANIAEALDYEWKTIHTKCRQSGTGHVYNKFRKKGTSNWFTRDIACIVDERDYCVWCDVDAGKGYKLAENPSWWLSNKNR